MRKLRNDNYDKNSNINVFGNVIVTSMVEIVSINKFYVMSTYFILYGCIL